MNSRVSTQRIRVNDELIRFHCLGCKQDHTIQHGDCKPSWGWNKSMEYPTFTPSIKVTGIPVGEDGWDANHICHSFVTDGKIQYLADCSHELAGKTIELPEW